VIVHADAVVQPGTVMIEPFNAHPAHVAMTAAKSFDDFAFSANLISIEFL
jgi:hypothetical protein